MARSLKKGPFVDEKLLAKIQKTDKNQPIKTWSRQSVIIPEMVGFTFAVHNGKTHVLMKIVEEMVGHRLGEFSPTRIFKKHGGRTAREQEQGVGKQAGTGPSLNNPAIKTQQASKEDK